MFSYVYFVHKTHILLIKKTYLHEGMGEVVFHSLVASLLVGVQQYAEK